MTMFDGTARVDAKGFDAYFQDEIDCFGRFAWQTAVNRGAY